RAYTLEVHNSTKKIREEINQNIEVKSAILDSIDPYKFEEMIAELLRSQGFDIFLTSKSGDKGRDIIAAFYENSQQYLMMVECKRRKGNSVLGPVEARALLGQFYFEKIQGTGFNCAMLVTSAGSIGPTAVDIQQQTTELSIRDRDAIIEWISSYGNLYNNLWIPKRFKELF
ncbi:MAG: restriction endonuclease, partial [Trichormus sp.]